MRQFAFIPCYYEWHLIDTATEETLHNVEDPSESMEYYHSVEELEERSKEILLEADTYYENHLDYDGVLLDDDKRLSEEEMNAAAKVMAEALYNYYIKQP